MEDMKFEVGDRLVYSHATAGHHYEAMDEVVEITKSGNVKTKRRRIFTPDGRIYRCGPWNSSTIRKATPEDAERIKKQAEIMRTLNGIHDRLNFQNLQLIDIKIAKRLLKALVSVEDKNK